MPEFNLQNFYTKAINELTLGEALEKHYQLNTQFTRWNEYPIKLQQETMKSHDIMHIVFGCNTSLIGEFRVELLTFFCSNLSLKQYLELVSNSEINKEPFEILKKIGYWKFVWVMVTRLWYVPYCIWVRFQLAKLWPLLETESLMNAKIGELRREYNIKILHN